jgi:hypothetical protein
MDHTDLTLEQLQALLNRTMDDLSYYARLRLRMKEQGFPGDDKLARAVDKVHAHLQDLRVHLHYRVTDLGGDGTRRPGQ